MDQSELSPLHRVTVSPCHPQSPRNLGYRMPAEWEPHAATWLSFPHNAESWPGKLEAAQRAYAKMVAALAQSESVHVNVNDAAMEAYARRLFEEAGARGEIIFHHFPTNDAWCRDHGAIFVKRPHPSQGGAIGGSVDRALDAGAKNLPQPLLSKEGSEGSLPSHGGVRGGSVDAPVDEVAKNLSQPLLGKEGSVLALDWRYNAWGGKYPPFDLDNEIPRQMADYLGVQRIAIDMVLEGGSIDVNGQGLLLTTTSCLLNKNRNPRLSQEQIEHALREMLGVEKILWLNDGIVGDDTDGHIDDITRFVAGNTVVTAIEDDPTDDNYGPLQQNLVLLQNMTNLAGEPLEIVQLPMPRTVHHNGQRVPASYANFYIANSVVLLPVYNSPADAVAAEILQSLFSDRRVVSIDCTDLAWGLGAFHCLTQQVPH